MTVTRRAQASKAGRMLRQNKEGNNSARREKQVPALRQAGLGSTGVAREARAEEKAACSGRDDNFWGDPVNVGAKELQREERFHRKQRDGAAVSPSCG